MKSKTQKREEARIRTEIRQSRSDAEQLSMLALRPGEANRERVKILRRWPVKA